MPTVWTGDGEAQFMLYAWSELQRTDLVPCRTAGEHVQAVAALAALHLLRVSFHVHTHGEGSDGVKEWTWSDLEGEYPRVSAYWMGVEVGKRKPDYDSEGPAGEETDASDAWHVVTGERYPDVIAALREAWGDHELFCALMASVLDEPRYPFADHADQDLGGGIVDSAAGYLWVTDGTPPAYPEPSRRWW